MAVFQFPLSSDRENYKFLIQLDGQRFTLFLKFNYRLALWIMHVMDANETPIVQGVPLLVGINLLFRFKQETLPLGDLFVVNLEDGTTEPDKNNIGKTTLMIYNEAA